MATAMADPEDVPSGPSPAAEAAAAASASAAAAASSLGVSLGLSDPSLDEGKKAGQSITELQAAINPNKKRPKVTHSLFFEDDRGLKKVLRTFPKIKFQGKGHEDKDLTLLLRHYKKWFSELYPYGEHFEDIVWKSRQVLDDKEKEDDGCISDPREKLHAFRFQYKNTPAEDDRAPAANAGAQISEEMRDRIAANRQKALELKKKREAAAGGAPAATAVPEELDMEDLWRIEEERAEAERKAPSQGAAPANFDEEEDDPFGFGGGGFDEDFGGSRPAPAAQATQAATGVAATASNNQAAAAPPGFDEEEEDPFGFGGGGFDDE